jgi:hypothetical protein
LESLVAFFFLFVLVFQLTAFGWVSALKLNGRLNNFLVSQLLGFTIVVWISSILAKVSAPFQVLVFTLSAVAVFGYVFHYFIAQHRQAFWAKGIPSLGVLVTLVVPAIYSFLASGGLGSTSFSFRRGPDSLGWGRATYTFCSGDTLSGLTNRVENQLGGGSLIDSFQRNPPEGIVSINSIASFSDQISAEFLIGADRAGIPMLAGGVCRFFGLDSSLQTMGGLIAWALFLTSLISLQIMRSYSSPRIISSLVSVISPLSVAILSVTLEGGVGQMVTLPFLLFSIYSLYSRNFQVSLFLFSLVMVLASAASTYIDLLYFAIPFFFLGFVFSGRIKEAFTAQHVKMFAIFAVASLVAVAPAAPSIFRLLFSFVGTNGAGGWDQGSLFLVSDLFSISNNSPFGGFVALERSGPLWMIDILLSLAILVSVALIGRKSIPFVIVILGYLVLTYLVYIIGATNVNNYRVWKYAMYATAFMPLLFSLMFSRPNSIQPMGSSIQNRLDKLYLETKRPWGFAKQTLLTSLGYVLLLSTALSSFSWIVDWEGSKTRSLSPAAILELNSLTPLYDIQVLSHHHLEAVHFAAVSSDLRFGTSNRWSVVLRSEPPRPLAYLIKISETCDRQCSLNEWSGLTENKSLREVPGLKFFVVLIEESSS